MNKQEKELQTLLKDKRAERARVVLTATSYMLATLADGLNDRMFPEDIRRKIAHLRGRIGTIGVELGLLANKDTV